jgi:hypothetical protein
MTGTTRTVTVYGASDDNIELEGVIYEEFPYKDSTDYDGKSRGDLVAFSDGTVIRVTFDGDDRGNWRITPVHRGTATLTVTQVADSDEGNTDRAVLDPGPDGDPIRWAVHGITYEPARH